MKQSIAKNYRRGGKWHKRRGKQKQNFVNAERQSVFSWGHTDYHLLPRQSFILTIFLVDLDSARPIRARMQSRLVPISSSFSFDLSIASVTRESTMPRLGEVNGGSESRRDRHSAGVLARLATVTAACRLAGRCSVSARRRADAQHRASAAFFALGSES